ncbi:MAG: C1 family peptidase [Planctomycetota bacterium]|jgi:bleomycin hydrolase
MKDSLIYRMALACQLIVTLTASSLLGAEGALSVAIIEQFRSGCQMDAHTRAMYNAITNNDIRELALNREVLKHHNEIFSHKVETKGVTDQKKSGRCWLFAGLNVMRPAVIKKYNLESFEFSQSYLSFWDKLEKANTFLERIIEFRERDVLDREMELILRQPISDGGYWENVVDLIGKHGVVPKDIMPETNSSENTYQMNRVIGQKLRSDAVKLRKMAEGKEALEKLRAAKNKMLAETYRMLVMNYGEPPSEFEWRFEDANLVVSESVKYTPKSFFEEFVGVDLNEYVNIFNDTTKDYGKHYQIRLSRNLYDGHDINYANVEIGTLKGIAVKSVLDDSPMLFAADVGYDQSRELGIMEEGLYDYESIYNIDMDMSKAERAMYRNSIRGHGMVLVGVDMREGKVVKWQVENSWGQENGSKGYWTLYDKWFDLHVYNIIVKKKYVPEEILKIYELPSIILPPWDPMLSPTR